MWGVKGVDWPEFFFFLEWVGRGGFHEVGNVFLFLIYDSLGV